MSRISHPFATLIEHEERIRNTYRDLLGEAVQSNIRYFLKPFMENHNNLLCKLKSYGKLEKETGVPDDFNMPVALSATDHLESEGSVDLTSLQSVLLYIAKTEAESLDEFEDLTTPFADPGMRDYLEGIIDEKRLITTKADRLYHDMIESKIS